MELLLGFTDKQITPWAGMALLKRMLDHIGWNEAVLRAQLPQPGSNRGYAPEQLVGQFMLSLWCGANRFEHLEVTRFDGVLGQVFGFGRMANYKALTRLLDKFDQASIARTFPGLYRHLFEQVGLQTLTLDLDSTVLSRYGVQQGASRGYNPSKRGRASHHPLMAFVADTRMLANVWLRPGNAHTANNAIAFLQSSTEHLGPAKRVGLLRADCENRIKELKYDFALGTLSRQNFWATEAAMHWVMLAFNLMSLFRTAMQRQINKTGSMQTMASLRQQLFAQAGFITKNGRSRTLKMATAMQRREWVSGLWNATKSFELPWPVKPIFTPAPTG